MLMRNMLLEMRETREYRDSKRRNGAVYKKSDGTFGLGPFTLEARKIILRRLLELENATGMSLITEAELKVIDQIWDEEGDLTCRSLVDIFYDVKGYRLSWDEYKQPRFDGESIKEIEEIALKYDVPLELITKLIIAVDTTKHITKNNKTQKLIDAILNQGWLHYDKIEGALKNED